MSDDDETTPEAVVRPEKNEDGKWVCPECGEEFEQAIRLGLHRKNKHGVAGTSKTATGEKRRRRQGSPAGTPRQESRKSKTRKALVDLANLSDSFRGRDTQGLPERLADLIREDADAIAEVVSQIASKLDPVAFAVDHLLVFIAPVTGLSRVIRWTLRAWRKSMEERAAMEPEFPEQPAEPSDWRDPPEPVYGPPDEPADGDK